MGGNSDFRGVTDTSIMSLVPYESGDLERQSSLHASGMTEIEEDEVLEGVELRFVAKDVIRDVLMNTTSTYGTVNLDYIYDSLQRHATEEHLEFLLAVKVLRRRDIVLRRDVDKILSQFLVAEATREINIESSMSNKLLVQLDKELGLRGPTDPVDKERVVPLFRATEEAVIDLIARQSYVQEHISSNVRNASAKTLANYSVVVKTMAFIIVLVAIALIVTPTSPYIRIALFPFILTTLLIRYALRCKM